jgi:1-acyl-sn-glycerol-3-phosphate acyltransferase
MSKRNRDQAKGKAASTPAAKAGSQPEPKAPSRVEAKPSTVEAKPSTVEVKPSTVEAKPSTVEAKVEAPAKTQAVPVPPVMAAPSTPKPAAVTPARPVAATSKASPPAPKTKSQGARAVDARSPGEPQGEKARASNDASGAPTVAPPAKRQRSSEPKRPSVPQPAVVVAAPALNGRSAAPLPSAPLPSSLPQTEPAVHPEPPLELAASIAVSSNRADSEAAARLARSSSGDPRREAAAFGSSQSLLSTDYYFRQYGVHALSNLVAEVDDFGFDPHVDGKVRPLLEAVCKRYFRVELVGAENIPAEGRALLVANRAGALPWDGLVLRTTLRAERPELSPLRWLAEDSIIHYPFMGVYMNRLGAVRACPENAERLLSQSRLVAVFPEGAQGSRKLFRDRYRLQRFGRGGYVKLALKLGVPIYPTAIIGAEETNPVLSRSRLLGRILGSDSAPITPTFPWLGLAGLLPAPVRWRIAVGAPIDLSSYGPESADDALVVHRLNEQIRSSLQALVDQGKSARGSALFG